MSENVVLVTNANYETEVLNCEQVVLLDFWAQWCAPCRKVGPMVDQLADDFLGRAKVGKVDIEAHRHLAEDLSISSIPTLVLFKNGVEVDRIMGAQPKDQLAALIEKHL